jgi:hypothetical protein
MTEKFISVNVAPLIDVKNIAVKTGQNINNVTTTKDLSSYYSKLAEQWAHGEGLVEGVDYSSKTYAGVAQEAAENAQGVNMPKKARELLYKLHKLQIFTKIGIKIFVKNSDLF